MLVASNLDTATRKKGNNAKCKHFFFLRASNCRKGEMETSSSGLYITIR